MVAKIVGGEQAVRMLRVAHNTIEIDDCVKMAGRTNPCVYGLAPELVAMRSNWQPKLADLPGHWIALRHKPESPGLQKLCEFSGHFPRVSNYGYGMMTTFMPHGVRVSVSTLVRDQIVPDGHVHSQQLVGDGLVTRL